MSDGAIAADASRTRARGGTVWKRIRSRQGLVSLLLAVLLAVAIYPEVVFLGGSLSATGLRPVVDPSDSADEVSLLPDVGNAGPRARERDAGARLWQFEPATKFMHRAVADGESPWWNPYSGSGSYGPETLADIKLSPFVLLVAATGATSTSFTVVALGFIVMALYCLQQLFCRSLGLPRSAGVAAGLVFLLNGWAIADITSSPGAPYLLFPVVLYGLVELLRRPGPLRFLAAVVAYGALLTTTFVPVAILMLALVHAVALAVDAWWRRDEPRDGSRAARVGRLLARQAIVPLVALAVTAFVWLPDLVALRRSGGDLASYTDRSLPIKQWMASQTLLSPLSFRSQFPKNSWTITIGAVAVVLMVAALPRARALALRLLALTGAAALLGIALHLGVPGFRLVAELPGFWVIGVDYWGALIGAALTIGVGVAISVAHDEGLSARVGLITAGLLATLVLLGLVTGGRQEGIERLGPVITLLVIGALCVVLVTTGERSDRRGLLVGLMVGVLAVELLGYQNRVRVERTDADEDVPSYVEFLRENVGDGRVLNAGRNALYPEWGTALGIRQVEMLNVTQIPEYRDFYGSRINPVRHGLFLQVGNDPSVPFRADDAALDLLSVRYLVVDEDLARYDAGVADRYPLAFRDENAGVNVYENPGAFARAFLTPALGRPDDVATTGDPAGLLTLTTTDDQLLLDEAERLGIPSRSDTASAGTARISVDENDKVQIDVSTDRPSILVLGDTYQRDWSATVNGEPVHVGRVDDVVRGVVVPSGQSTVVFRYRSPARTIGLIVSAVAISALIIGLALWTYLRSARSRRTAPKPRTPTERQPSPA